MKTEIREIDGEKYLYMIPENLRETIGHSISVIESNWAEKSRKERIVDYIVELLADVHKNTKNKICQDVKQYINTHSHTITRDSKKRKIVYNIGIKRFINSIEEETNENIYK